MIGYKKVFLFILIIYMQRSEASPSKNNMQLRHQKVLSKLTQVVKLK